MKYLKKKEIIVGCKYWVRLPHNLPNGALNQIVTKKKTEFTITVDLANDDSPYRNIATFQFSSIDFIERIL